MMQQVRPRLTSILVFILLIALGIFARLMWVDIPNFKPVASLALFAGFFFAQYRIAVAVPLIVMCISDWWLGGYQPLLKLAVYGSVVAPIFLRGVSRWSVWQIHSGATWSVMRGSATLLSCSLGASVLFFVVTNFVTWVVTPWYDRSLAGVVECYLAAVPFFRYTLAGDMAFTSSLFGTYCVIQALLNRRSLPTPEPACCVQASRP